MHVCRSMSSMNRIYIEQNYIDLKVEELRLTHEYREKLKQEKDERAEASRLAREEAKLRLLLTSLLCLGVH